MVISGASDCCKNVSTDARKSSQSRCSIHLVREFLIRIQHQGFRPEINSNEIQWTYPLSSSVVVSLNRRHRFSGASRVFDLETQIQNALASSLDVQTTSVSDELRNCEQGLLITGFSPSRETRSSSDRCFVELLFCEFS